MFLQGYLPWLLLLAFLWFGAMPRFSVAQATVAVLARGGKQHRGFIRIHRESSGPRAVWAYLRLVLAASGVAEPTVGELPTDWRRGARDRFNSFNHDSLAASLDCCAFSAAYRALRPLSFQMPASTL